MFLLSYICTSDAIFRNCDEMRIEITFVVSSGGGQSGSFKYLISHWKICVCLWKERERKKEKETESEVKIEMTCVV